MKAFNLDGAIGNKIKLSGEIEATFIIRVGVTITFAEGATFKGKPIKSGQSLYNGDYVPKKFSLSSSGTLSLISAEEMAVEIRAEAEKEAITQIKIEAEQEAREEIAAEEFLITKTRTEAVAEVTLEEEISCLKKEIIVLSAEADLLRGEEGIKQEIEELDKEILNLRSVVSKIEDSTVSEFPSEPTGPLKRSTAESHPLEPPVFERDVEMSLVEWNKLFESIQDDLACIIL
jgi:hypothetical protein